MNFKKLNVKTAFDIISKAYVKYTPDDKRAVVYIYLKKNIGIIKSEDFIILIRRLVSSALLRENMEHHCEEITGKFSPYGKEVPEKQKHFTYLLMELFVDYYDNNSSERYTLSSWSPTVICSYRTKTDDPEKEKNSYSSQLVQDLERNVIYNNILKLQPLRVVLKIDFGYI